jgi:hypothetical protein
MARGALVALGAVLLMTGALLPATQAGAQPTSWSIVPSANTSPAQENQLLGVSCPTTTFCVAVGHAKNGSGIDQTLIETFNGSSWSIVPSPNTSSSLFNDLAEVSCTSATFCIAVGSANSPTHFLQTLVETFDGSNWSIVSSPNTSPTEPQYLNGLTCQSATFCVAVGAYEIQPGLTQTLVLTYDGTNWTIAPSPNSSPTEINILGTVSCTSATNCVAVGTFFGGAASSTLIETFDGTNWVITPSPNAPASKGNTLYGVSCVSPSACEAVGNYADSDFTLHTLVEKYDGTSWVITASPNTSQTQDNTLLSVWCTSSTSCVAAGNTGKPSPVQQTLLEGLSDTTWSIIPSPNTSPSQENSLGDVTCPDATECVAVGSSNNTDEIAQTLAMVGTVPPPPTSGYWITASDGGIFSFGNAGFYGSMGGMALNKPVVGMAAVPDSKGYWLVASDGGVFTFGEAAFYGSKGGMALNRPVVGMAATPDGNGYWLVASDGGVFTFGDAAFYGSKGGMALNKRVVGMAATPDGKGYWLVASDGGVFTFGDAAYYGSKGGMALNRPVVGMAATPDGNGYWLVASDGGIFTFGNAAFYGSQGGMALNKPVVGMAATADGNGYWLVGSDGGVFTFGGATFYGSLGGMALNAPVVGIAATKGNV